MMRGAARADGPCSVTVAEARRRLEMAWRRLALRRRAAWFPRALRLRAAVDDADDGDDTVDLERMRPAFARFSMRLERCVVLCVLLDWRSQEDLWWEGRSIVKVG